MTLTRVLRLTEFKDFLEHTDKSKPVMVQLGKKEAGFGLGQAAWSVSLSLQSTSTDGDILWLCEMHETYEGDGNGIGKCVMQMHAHLRNILRDKGYTVIGGSFGLSDEIKPINTAIEIFRWERVNNVWTVNVL